MNPDADADAARAALAACSTFAGLPPQLIDEILPIIGERRFLAGERIIGQGEPGDCLFVIVRGQAVAQVHDSGRQVHDVGEFRDGDVVGEMALVTSEPRSADVVARTDVHSLVLPADDFHRLAGRYAELNIVLTHLLAERLGRSGRDGLGGKVFGGCRIRGPLGRGGMSVVYDAEEIETGRDVALKMMSHRLLYEPGAVARFRAEADLVAQLEHENVARLYGRFPAFRTHFLVMERIDGPSLTQVLRRHGALPEPTVRGIVGQLAGALLYVHGRGVVHRDLTPNNVMLDGHGNVKLMDFGVAQQDPEMGDHTQTLPGRVLGTPKYMAPEQLAGGPVDHRADLYSLSCLIYELLAGSPLFAARSFVELVQKKTLFRMPEAADIGAGITGELHRLIEVGLSTDPAGRDMSLEDLTAWATPIDRRFLAVH